MTTYNGWTNYATWRVNLEMFDDCSPEDMTGSRTRPECADLAAILRESAEEILEAQCVSNERAESLVFSYAMAFLDDVNWHEIARDMIEAHANQYETEGEDA